MTVLRILYVTVQYMHMLNIMYGHTTTIPGAYNDTHMENIERGRECEAPTYVNDLIFPTGVTLLFLDHDDKSII